LYITKALIAQKKYEIALKIINKMLALYPTDISYLEQLAIAYKATNSKYLEKLYEDILILDPNNVLVRSALK
jgi:tetratricopeptide (TPR) repeat protein